MRLREAFCSQQDHLMCGDSSREQAILFKDTFPGAGFLSSYGQL